MRIGLVVHGVLLVLALLLAYQTATRSTEEAPDYGDVEVWKLQTPTSFSLESEKKSVTVERRKDAAGEYLWARIETRRKVKKAKKEEAPAKESDASPAGDGDAPESGNKDEDKGTVESATAEKPAAAVADAGVAKPAAEEEFETTVTELPLSSKADEALSALANFKALRILEDVGEDSDAASLLANNPFTLTFQFPSGERVLTVSSKSIYGGKERYVRDEASKKIYVVDGTLIGPVLYVRRDLALKSLHEFSMDEVASITVETSAGKAVLEPVEASNKSGAKGRTWRRRGESAEDPALTNFYNRVEKLKPLEFDTEAGTSPEEPIASIVYKDKGGAELGYAQLFRRKETKDNGTEVYAYYAKTEATRVMAKVARLDGDRVDEDLSSLFGLPKAPELKSEAPKVEADAAAGDEAHEAHGGHQAPGPHGGTPKAPSSRPPGGPTSPHAGH